MGKSRVAAWSLLGGSTVQPPASPPVKFLSDELSPWRCDSKCDGEAAAHAKTNKTGTKPLSPEEAMRRASRRIGRAVPRSPMRRAPVPPHPPSRPYFDVPPRTSPHPPVPIGGTQRFAPNDEAASCEDSVAADERALTVAAVEWEVAAAQREMDAAQSEVEHAVEAARRASQYQ